LIASNQFVKQELGWSPQYSLKDMIKSDYDFRILMKLN
jgi:UDP-glucose 4-epimerase